MNPPVIALLPVKVIIHQWIFSPQFQTNPLRWNGWHNRECLRNKWKWPKIIHSLEKNRWFTKTTKKRQNQWIQWIPLASKLGFAVTLRHVCDELSGLLDRCCSAGVRVVILRSSPGVKVWSSGHDVRDFKRVDGSDARSFGKSKFQDPLSCDWVDLVGDFQLSH